MWGQIEECSKKILKLEDERLRKVQLVHAKETVKSLPGQEDADKEDKQRYLKEIKVIKNKLVGEKRNLDVLSRKYIDYLNAVELLQLKKNRKSIFENEKNLYKKEYLKSGQGFDLQDEKAKLEKRIDERTIYKHYRQKWVKLVSIEHELEFLRKISSEIANREKEPPRKTRDNLLSEIKKLNNELSYLEREKKVSVSRIGSDKSGLQCVTIHKVE